MNTIWSILKNKCSIKKHFSFILIGQFTGEVFGIQITIGNFIFQYAFGKFCIFNIKTHK